MLAQVMNWRSPLMNTTSHTICTQSTLWWPHNVEAYQEKWFFCHMQRNWEILCNQLGHSMWNQPIVFSVESSVFSRGVWKCHLRNHDFIFLQVGTQLVLRITTLYFYIHHIKDFLLWQLNLMACTYWVHSEVPNFVQLTTGGQLHQPRWTGVTL